MKFYLVIESLFKSGQVIFKQEFDNYLDALNAYKSLNLVPKNDNPSRKAKLINSRQNIIYIDYVK